MNRKFKVVIIGLSALMMCCCYLYIEFYNKPRIDTLAAETDVRISSHKLAKSFNTDETKANADFVEKTIEVVGSIKEINYANNRYTVLLQGQSNASNVICDVLPASMKMAKELRPGQTVRLKGICKGYLLDVVMLNCILING